MKEKSHRSKSLKLSRELAKIPVEKYRLAEDGRKWKAISHDRMGLAGFLGVHGDGDGTRIFLSIKTMMLHFKWSHGKVCYLLEDLRELLLLEDTPNYSHHGTRIRQMNLAAFLDRPEPPPLPGPKPRKPKPPKSNPDSGAGDTTGVQHTNGQESNIASKESNIDTGVQDSGVQHSEAGVQDTTQESKIEGQESNVTLDTTVTGPSPKGGSLRSPSLALPLLSARGAERDESSLSLSAKPKPKSVGAVASLLAPTKNQIKNFISRAASLGWNNVYLKSHVQSKYGVRGLRNLTLAQFSELVAHVERVSSRTVH
jgi:hypothetical protein